MRLRNIYIPLDGCQCARCVVTRELGIDPGGEVYQLPEGVDPIEHYRPRDTHPVKEGFNSLLCGLPWKPVPEPPRPSLPEEDAKRGLYPMAEGLLDYFPNALAEVSRISYEGNLKHNPGEPMHWARGKSTDHRNKVIRHTVDATMPGEPGIEHAAQAAWRSLAFLQEKIEQVREAPTPRNAWPAGETK